MPPRPNPFIPVSTMTDSFLGPEALVPLPNWALWRAEGHVLCGFQGQFTFAYPVQVNPLHSECPHLEPVPQGHPWWPPHRRAGNMPWREARPPGTVGNKGRSARCPRGTRAGSRSPPLQAAALGGPGRKPGPGPAGSDSGDTGRAVERPGRAGLWLEEGWTERAPHLPGWNFSSGRPGVGERNGVRRRGKTTPGVLRLASVFHLYSIIIWVCLMLSW